MNPEERIVRVVLEKWNDGLASTLESWRRHCTDDLLWWNSARGEISRLDACLAGIAQMWEHLDVVRVDVPIRTLLSEPGRVVVERSDNLVKKNGDIIYAPVTGVVEFINDKIVRWRDYCDDWMLKLELGNEPSPALAPVTAHSRPLF